MRRRHVLVPALILITSTLAAAAPPPDFDVVILPTVVINGVELPIVIGRDLSNSGHIAGTAGSSSPPRTAGFLFTPDGRMIGIDPRGDFQADAMIVNDRGEVLGDVVGPRDEFLFSEAEGVVSLRDTLPNPRRRVFVADINSDGTLVGFSDGTALYFTRDAGWREIRELHPDLQAAEFDNELTVQSINDRGDMVLRIGRGRIDDTVFIRVENLLLTSSGSLHRFGAEGPLVSPVSRATRSRRIVGTMNEIGGPLQAFSWSSRGGVVPIEVPGAKETLGHWAPLEGVVAGEARFGEGIHTDSVFLHSLDGEGPDFVVPRRKFKRLGRRNGIKRFRGAQAFAFNERLEFIGDVGSEGGRQPISYFYRRGKGLFTVQSIIDRAGADLRVEFVTDLNQHGQILVHGIAPGGRGTSALLTPVE